MEKSPRISIIAAIGKNRELGLGNKLLWNIPADLKRFRSLTLGHPVIMGQNTFDSIVVMLGKPLPGRTNIVTTLDRGYGKEWADNKAVRIVYSPEEALEAGRSLDSEEVFIGGGAQIYTLMLPYAERLYLTLIEDEKEADAFFPPYERIFTKKLAEELGEHEGMQYRWVTLEK